MKTILARNVNDALQQGIALIKMYGEEVDSRVGKTLEIPTPVSTVYHRPWERVLINSARDANPFFHLMESLWILAGRDDTKFLCEFNKRMVDYSDNGRTFNAPYGFRLRKSISYDPNQDQLQEVINILKKDPNSRQAVCQIWDPLDLTKSTMDKACNMSIIFRVRNNKLSMTVYNRSNDMIWGAYGANVVQFSMIQEYVAAHLSLQMGSYTQVTNSYHIYTEGPGGKVWDAIKGQSITCENQYQQFTDPLVIMDPNEMEAFDFDLNQFFTTYDHSGIEGILSLNSQRWESAYFKKLVIPVLNIYRIYKELNSQVALRLTEHIIAPDWKRACQIWLENRK